MKQSVAELVIEKFGGTRKMAQAMGLTDAAISLWKKRNHGRVPARRWSAILKAATKRGITLTFEDLAR